MVRFGWAWAVAATLMTWVAQPAQAAPSLTMSEPVFVNDDAVQVAIAIS